MWKWVIRTTAGRILAILIALSVVYLAVARPEWATNAWNRAAEQVLSTFGVGIVPVTAWVLVVIFALRYFRMHLLRRWRLVLGSAGLVAAFQGILGYFQGSLPLVGHSDLGGALGRTIQGQVTVLSHLRVGGLGLLSAWVMLPGRPRTLVALRLLEGVGYMGRGLLWLFRWAIRQRPWKRSPRKEADAPGLRLSEQVQRSLIPDVSTAQVTAMEKGLPAPDESAQATPRDAVEEPEELFALPDPVTNGMEETAREQTPREVSAADTERAWPLPSLSVLRDSEVMIEVGEEHLATARLIEQSLAQHQVEVQVAEIKPGPTVTLFGLVPGWVRRGKGSPLLGEGAAGESGEEAEGDAATGRSRVKVDSVVARERDLALALAAPSLRIQAPVPGESIIGVEVPNRHSSMVSIRSIMESDAYQELVERDVLPVALGQASAGEAVAIDLISMPHLLIAGATGSGKSVCLNSIIASLITHQQPFKTRLLLVDPKRVELTPYNGIPHLVTPVAVEPERVIRLLKGAIQEMLHRFRLLEEAGVRNIQSYNRSPRAVEPIPYLIICIDELADLMMAASYEVEQSICRLAQMGRATGIHMVVATQRPSVDVVTGLIKANFPTRISFAVASQVDSRTILDMAGAERLLGRGDMLFLSRESAKPRRVQGVFISEEEAWELAEHWRQAHGGPVRAVPLEEMAQVAEVTAAEDQSIERDDDQDSLYERALDMAIRYRQVSTSLLQRRLRIGYPRAARLMDLLEQEGVVKSGSEPGKPREVLVPPSEPPLAGTDVS